MIGYATKGFKKLTFGILGLGMFLAMSTGFAAAQLTLRLPANAFLLANPSFAAPDLPTSAAAVAADSPWSEWMIEAAPNAGFSPVPRTLVTQSVQVFARRDILALAPDRGIADHISARQVELAAGAYNDIPRFLQTLPGVQFDSDARNTYLVNGGNAMENLYVIDGVEVPSINHMSASGSTGGFVSVIDTGAISSLDLHKQLYGSEYSGTLSSVLDLHTVIPETDQRHGNVVAGFAGVGFMIEQPIGHIGSIMTQVRKSVLNYFTDDIGIGGVPIYFSVLSTGIFAIRARDTVKTLFLTSSDSLNLTPFVGDWANPALVDSDYTGHRSTGAVTWHRALEDGGSDLQFNYSTLTTSTIQDNARNLDVTAPVYSDRLSESPFTLRYDLYRQGDRYRVQAGAVASIHSLNYVIDQAQGFPTPYSVDPTPVDASNIAVTGTPLNYAAYAESSVRAVGKLELQGGLRYERWGINDSSAWMPRVGVRLPVGTHVFFHGGIGRYSEMPSLPVMLGTASNIGLKPIRNLQTQFGAVLTDNAGDRISASVFGRDYTDYPVSTEFPTLSLADLIDPFGLPSLYMPMVSVGRGKVRGTEIEFATAVSRRVFAQINLTSESVNHTALDGVWRRANYDMPLLANILDGVHIGRHQIVTSRYSIHTGTPYTPFLIPQSEAQNREIFDLSQVNTKRGGNYARLDVRYEIDIPMGRKSLKIFAGVDNALNKSNFYQYVMLPGDIGYGPYALTQMSRYPDGGASWSF